MAAWEELSFRVSQAQGMVSVQAECSLPEALVMMQDRATVQHQTIVQVADAILNHSIRFGPDAL